MAAILGLVSGKTFTDKSFHNRNNRRRIFHDYPVGQFPLTGLLSLMDTEETDSSEFGWYEKRFETPETTVAAGASFTNTSNVSLGATATLAAGTTYRVIVASTAEFQARQQIWIPDLYVSAGVFTEVKGVITQIVSSTVIEFTASQATGAIVNSGSSPTGVGGCSVFVIGNAYGEGATSGSGRLYPPINVTNYTQIFRNAFSFTRSAIKSPTNFDKTGIYREKAEDNLRSHMVEMEMAFLFGAKRTENVTEGGETVPRRLTGGIIHFLEQWEAADSVYRGGSGAAALTANTSDGKRIINTGTEGGGTAGTMKWSDFNKYLERAFRTTNDKSFEKLFLCGSGMLAAVNAALESKGQLNKDYGVQKAYGMNVVTWETPFGTVHFKTHPLFSRQANLRYNGLLLDVQNLKFRALNDSDTTLLSRRQAPDFDGRKDEWITEAGLEVNFPESHMYFKNMQILNPSA